jgi:hypothetical protein
LELVLLVHLATTFVMVGIIWFVQIVHYPLFARVGAGGFPAYSGAHSRLTSLVVGPPMLAEAATAVALVLGPPQGVPLWLAVTGLALLAVVWLSTAALQSPRHRELGGGFDSASHRSLVASNWLRTVCWSARGLVVLGMAARAAG